MREVIWNGSPTECSEFVKIVHDNCHHAPEGSHCQYDVQGRLTESCTMHQALTKDQRMIDGLVFARRQVGILLAEEFNLTLSVETREKLMHEVK